MVDRKDNPSLNLNMSETILKLIPRDPEFIPRVELQTEAVAVLKEVFPHADKIQSNVFDGIQFVDPGSNLEKITCPKCGMLIDIAQWQEMMNERFDKQNGFSTLKIQLLCCGANSSLNDLLYSWPAGFASYILKVRNPQGDIDATAQKQLEGLLGCEITKIIAQY